MNIKNYLWVFPFLSFLIGYFVLQKLSNVDQINAPAIVGKQLQEAISILSNKNLNIRLITQKDDGDLPQGTILSQTPSAGQKIKPHQTLHIVISKKPKKIPAPNLINKSIKQIEKIVKKYETRNKIYYLPSNCPLNSCIAQYPIAGNPLETNKIITYISLGNNKPVLIPDFNGKSIREAIEFLENMNIHPEVIHESLEQKNHICDEYCIIINQRPLSGSIINLDPNNPILIQLQVKNIQ